MRSPTARRGSAQRFALQLTPLIDVVFLLLSYFLFTISLTMLEGVLPSKLALGEHASQRALTEEPVEEVLVRVVQRGDRVYYFLDDWPLEDFRDLARRLARLPDDTLVVIDAAPGTRVAPVVRTYNQCLETGLTRVVFPVSS